MSYDCRLCWVITVHLCASQIISHVIIWLGLLVLVHKHAILQVIASLLSNWGQHWFTHFPHPPLPVLGQLGEVLAFHDPDLFQAMSSGQSMLAILATILTELCLWPESCSRPALQSNQEVLTC